MSLTIPNNVIKLGGPFQARWLRASQLDLTGAIYLAEPINIQIHNADSSITQDESIFSTQISSHHKKKDTRSSFVPLINVNLSALMHILISLQVFFKLVTEVSFLSKLW